MGSIMNKSNFVENCRHALAALVGESSHFPLEMRMIHAVLLIGIAAIGYNILLQISLGLDPSILHYGLLCVILILAYYLSRFRKRGSLSTLLAVFGVYGQFALDYFAHGGSSGSSLHSLTLVFFLSIIISPKQQYPIWLSLFMVGVPLLLYIEYSHPEKINYEPEVGSPAYYVNMGSTYLVNLAGIFLGLWYMKNAYYKDKQIAEKRSEKLSQSNQERSRLFSILSHDLNSPLATLQTYLHMLKGQELPASVRAKVENELAETLNSTQELLYNILSWSKNDLNPLQVKTKSIDLKEALAPVLRLLLTTAMQKGVTLDIQLDGAQAIVADEHLFPFIVRNILGNAIKFSPAPGIVQLTAETTDKYCILRVHDNGEGIPYAKQRSIFSMDVQSTLGSKGEKGSGLGLFLCKEYIRLLKGEIWFESLDSRGTTFFIQLPAAPEPANR